MYTWLQRLLCVLLCVLGWGSWLGNSLPVQFFLASRAGVIGMGRRTLLSASAF